MRRPKKLKGIRKMRHGYYYRIRNGRSGERLVPLGKDPDKAVVKALELRRAIKAGEPVTEERTALTVAVVAKQWLGEYVMANRSPRFYEETVSRVNRYLIPFMGKERIEDVTARTLFAYRNWLGEQTHGEAKKRLSTGTVRHALGEARQLLNYCLNVEILDRSPVPTRGLMPRLEERVPDTLSPAECDVLRRLPEPHGFVLRFLLASGIRWGEMARAQAADIQEGSLLVRKSKAGKVRRIPLPGDVLAECRGRVGRLCPLQDSVSFNRRVRELVAEYLATLDEEQQRALESLGRFHVHLTRHTFATDWIAAGGSLAGLKAIMGHSSIAVTEQYGKIGDDMVVREARRLELHRKAAGQ